MKNLTRYMVIIGWCFSAVMFIYILMVKVDVKTNKAIIQGKFDTIQNEHEKILIELDTVKKLIRHGDTK